MEKKKKKNKRNVGGGTCVVGRRRQEKERERNGYIRVWCMVGKNGEGKKKIICLLGAKCRLEEVYVIF